MLSSMLHNAVPVLCGTDTDVYNTVLRDIGVTVVLKWCYSGVTVVPQWCRSGVTVVLHLCYNGVTLMWSP
jgi:hypothetical protein